MKQIKTFIQTWRNRYYYKRGKLNKIPNLVAPYSTPNHYHPNLPIKLDEELPERLSQFLNRIDHTLNTSGRQGSRDRVLKFFVATIFQLYNKHMIRAVSPNHDSTLAASHIIEITTDEIGFSVDLAIAALECNILHENPSLSEKLSDEWSVDGL